MRGVLVTAAAVVGVGLVWGQEPPKVKYPESKRVEHTDEYHGTRVPDPYRWLEDDVRKSSEVADWVKAENEAAEKYLAAIPEREGIKKRITDLWNFEKYTSPSKHGTRYFFGKNDGLQNQNVFYVQDGPDAEPRVLLDPNKWTKDGTAALAGLASSDDGKYLAYALAEAGSDWQTWKVIDVATARPLPDELKWVKFSGASWTPDGRGFFYSRFPEPAKDAAFQGLNVNQKLYYHRLGTPQADDVLVYHRPDQPKWTIQGSVSEDGRYLVIRLNEGTTSQKNRLAYKDLSEPYGLVTDLTTTYDDEVDFIENDGPVFYCFTDRDAPKKKIVAVDVRDPDPKNWKTVVPEAKDVMLGATLVGGQLACSYLQDAKTQVKFYTTGGRHVRDVQFPDPVGTAGGFGGKKSDTTTYYTFTSFNRPPAVYEYDVATGTSKLLRQPKVKFNPDDYAVEQVKYKSKDGTEVPMFVCYKKGLKRDGNNPCLLYGYGGFNISLTPGFSVSRLQWMEMGGVFAMPNLRGGGEYGEQWHRAGTKLKKQNVFDDFIAAAEYLIAEKYTSTPKLAIQGGSNGGLLVGACMTQRPDLYGACLPAVGVMDMLRFQKFTAGRFWTDDYGSSDNKDEFEALKKYSPYHNLKPGTKYPATLVTTADTDDRVVPGHSFKFIAQLQYCQAGDAPVLARIETKAGHGAGKPTSKMIEEVADQWAFLVKNLNVKAKP